MSSIVMVEKCMTKSFLLLSLSLFFIFRMAEGISLTIFTFSKRFNWNFKRVSIVAKGWHYFPILLVHCYGESQKDLFVFNLKSNKRMTFNNIARLTMFNAIWNRRDWHTLPVNKLQNFDLAHTAGVGCLGNFDCGVGRVSRTGQRPESGCCHG